MGLSQAEAARAQALSQLAADRASAGAGQEPTAGENVRGLAAIGEDEEDDDDAERTASVGARLEQKLAAAAPGAGVAEGRAARERAQTARHLEVVGDAVLSRAAWFQPVIEVAQVMEALTDRARVRLPDSFLLSKDTFLDLVLQDECREVTGCHPYIPAGSDSLPAPDEGEIVVPRATQLELRFDVRCASLEGHALEIAAPGCQESLFGRFGGGVPGTSGRFRHEIHGKAAKEAEQYYRQQK